MTPAPVATLADLRQEQRRIRRGVGLAALATLALLGTAHLYLPRLVDLPDASFEGRLSFWAVACMFIVLWVVVGVGMVSTGRRLSPDDIQGSAFAPPSPRIAVAVAFLQNTVEQALIAVFAQLALVVMAGAAALPLVAASAALFGVGRAAFLAGYRRGAGARSFGMALTVLPSLVALAISVVTLMGRITA